MYTLAYLRIPDFLREAYSIEIELRSFLTKVFFGERHTWEFLGLTPDDIGGNISSARYRTRAGQHKASILPAILAPVLCSI